MNPLVVMIFAGILLLVPAGQAAAGSKITVHGIYMVPYGNDAKEVSRPGWGLGAGFVTALPGAREIINGSAGLEFINLMSNTVDEAAAVEGVILPYTKDTDQWYARLRLGGQLGGLGDGFFRPYVGLNAALVLYAIDTDLDFHPGGGAEDFTKHAYDDIDAVFGYDVTAGADLNVSDKISVDGGVKYLRSISVPDQLGGGSERIYPEYFQIHLGIGFTLLTADL